MLAKLAHRISGRVEAETYPGALAGLIPVDLVLSLLAKRSYPLYRLWRRYGELTGPYFDQCAAAVAAPPDEGHLRELRARGLVRVGQPYSTGEVAEARAWVLERVEPMRRRAAELDPSGQASSVRWQDEGLRYEVDRRTGRLRIYFPRGPAGEQAERWPRILREFGDVPAWHALAQAYFGAGAVRAGQPYMMAEVLTAAPDIEPWHIDCLRPTLKSFLYLTDVGSAQGPLRFQPGTHVLDEARHRMFYRICNGGLGHAYMGEEESRRLDAICEAVTGPAGTALLFDTQVLHAGSWCTEGMRVALVNGYRPLVATRLNPRLFRDPRPVPSPWEKY
ncbi:MAG TPA: phytanoyl-CoA dioxygenase family protein [Polyangia bacterium]|jgi:hypothetical protein|nr:phytanoyl-CoA dioxygenase family protein [Polyangia bacterium]